MPNSTFPLRRTSRSARTETHSAVIGYIARAIRPPLIHSSKIVVNSLLWRRHLRPGPFPRVTDTLHTLLPQDR